jgi:hypothetical protein
VDASSASVLGAAAVMGFAGGLGLLARGFGGYRTAGRIADTSTSTISSLAAGEVRVSGIIEPAELTLTSLLQCVPCVYYRSSVGVERDDITDRSNLVEERSVGFRVRDASGSLRIFPRGARIDAPVRWHDSTGLMGDEPPGLRVRLEGAFAMAEVDDATAAAELLRVHDPGSATSSALLGATRGRREYEEARLEPGDEVTVVGTALPFGDLRDPTDADIGGGTDAYTADGDPEIAADLARARATGSLLTDPEDAWGNAAIPGFGIGRPVREPEIDPAANELPIASADEAARTERTFEIAPETLVLSAGRDAPLLIVHGSPGAATGRQEGRFLVGLLGAVLSIASAMVGAMVVSGGLGS